MKTCLRYFGDAVDRENALSWATGVQDSEFSGKFLFYNMFFACAVCLKFVSGLKHFCAKGIDIPL